MFKRARGMRWSLPALLVSLVAAGCDNSADSPTSPTGETRLSVYLTDAPGDVESVWVQVDDIVLVGQGTRVSLLEEPTDLINVTELTDAAVALLVAGVPVEPGRYTQVRFVLGGAVLLDDYGNVYAYGDIELPPDLELTGELTCPSCSQSGIKVKVPGGVELAEADDAGVLMDFDVSQSFGHVAVNSPDTVARLRLALEGRYAIERELGEGGMATVYLAKDLKHNRSVAVKVLKQELAAVVGAERFLAEIETTANLQHPHILPLFDSGEADGFLFYVMPHVEGESLRQRIDRDKQLPVEEAVQITTAVAQALQHAHDRGVIHRDIKPANILMQDGQPVVSDFGIALAVGAAGGTRLTETGLSVGTPFYMSPEQATGDQQVGPPSDTYALAAVLYEMLTGDPPYLGSTAQAVLGQIIAGDPVSATKKRRSVPANVDAAIRTALEKLPADRFTGAQDFAKALSDPGFRHGELAGAGAASGRRGQWTPLTNTFAAVAALLALTLGWSLLRPKPPLPVERFVSPFGDGQAPTAIGTAAFNLSPDGSMLVYRGFLAGGGAQELWVRRWEDVEPSPIRGTEGGAQPVVSPDGQEVAFQQGGEVKVVSLQGGPVRTLTTGIRPQWGTDGYIYATSDNRIVRAPATGGPPEPVTEAVDGEVHIVTDILPGDDAALLFTNGESPGTTA